MISEPEAERIVRDAAKRLGVPTPTISFQPRRIAFQPVSVMNDSVAITPAAREALSPEALNFAVVEGIIRDRFSRRGNVYRQVGMMLFGLLVSWSVNRAGAPRGVGVLAFLVSFFVALVTVVSVRSKWPSPKIDRMIVQALPNLDGARAYAKATDLQNLNGERPEAWTTAHGALFDLDRLERAAAS